MEELLRSEELLGGPSNRLAALRSAYQASGSTGLRRKRIELNITASGQQSPNAYDLAIDYAALGDTDQALDWLEKAYRVRDPKITLIGIEPLFDLLRSDPRFKDLSRRIGLPLRTS
jgi:hypothetical protein